MELQRKTNLNWRALRLAAATDLRHLSALAEKRDARVLVKAIEASQEVKTATTTAEEEKTDDEDVEGLKRGSKEPTGENGVTVKEEVLQAHAIEAVDVKMEVSEEIKAGVGAGSARPTEAADTPVEADVVVEVSMEGVVDA